MANTKELCRELVKLGGGVKGLKGTGELVCSHSSSSGRVRISHWTRRKTASRALEAMVRKARKARKDERG